MSNHSFLAISLQFALAATCVAADGNGRLRFDWPNPTASSPCDLAEYSAGARAPRFAGTVETQDIGFACIVQIPRRRFDALYRFCTVAYADTQDREHYACWVQYSPRAVTFLYSYSPESADAPLCAFDCSRK